MASDELAPVETQLISDRLPLVVATLQRSPLEDAEYK
jgi:hypothetical protein